MYFQVGNLFPAELLRCLPVSLVVTEQFDGILICDPQYATCFNSFQKLYLSLGPWNFLRYYFVWISFT